MIRFELLETRQLMAADLGVDVPAADNADASTAAEVFTPEDHATADRIFEESRFLTRTNLVYARLGNLSMVIDDHAVILQEDQIQVHSLALAEAGEESLTDRREYQRAGLLYQYEDGFLLASRTSNATESVLASKVEFFTIDQDGKLVLESESPTRSAPIRGIAIEGEAIFIGYLADDYYEGSMDEFNETELRYNGNHTQFHYIQDVYLPGGEALGTPTFSVASVGDVFIAPLGEDSFVLRGSDRFDYFDSYSSGNEPLAIELPEGVTPYENAVLDSEGSLVLRGYEFTTNGEPVIAEYRVEADGEAILLRESDQTSQQPFYTLSDGTRFAGSKFDNGMRMSESTFTMRNRQTGLSIFTDTGNGINEQQLDLQGDAIGLTPGFVLNDNEMILLRGNQYELVESGVPLDDVNARISALYLKRDENGDFKVSDSITLGELQPQIANFQPDGTVTLHFAETTLILRPNDGQLNVQELPKRDTFLRNSREKFVGVAGGVFDITTENVTYSPYDPLEATEASDTAIEELVSEPIPFDANGDDQVSALDALVIINALARQNSGEAEQTLATSSSPLDVNKDGIVSALDALVVINQLSRSSSDADGELVTGSQVATPQVNSLDIGDDDDEENVVAGLF